MALSENELESRNEIKKIGHQSMQIKKCRQKSIQCPYEKLFLRRIDSKHSNSSVDLNEKSLHGDQVEAQLKHRWSSGPTYDPCIYFFLRLANFNPLCMNFVATFYPSYLHLIEKSVILYTETKNRINISSSLNFQKWFNHIDKIMVWFHFTVVDAW